MSRHKPLVFAATLFFLLFAGLGDSGWAQSAPATAAGGVPGATVPRLVRFTGVVRDAEGNPRRGVTGITFALYQDQAGGPALWLETQNVSLDAQGRYTVLLGVNSAEGVPVELFTANEARWLGVQPEGLPERRVLLVSVPYALKAADAETLGGKPASSFVLTAAASDSTGAGPTGTSTTAAGTSSSSPAGTIGGSGVPNTLARFDNTGVSVNSSSVSDNGTAVSTLEPVGIGTTTPGAQLDIQLNTPTGQNALNSIVALSNQARSHARPTASSRR